MKRRHASSKPLLAENRRTALWARGFGHCQNGDIHDIAKKSVSMHDWKCRLLKLSILGINNSRRRPNLEAMEAEGPDTLACPPWLTTTSPILKL